jgi:ribonuclease BN (tRNA processing enzyme)
MGDRRDLWKLFGALISLAAVAADPAVARQPGSQTQIVLLGTGAVRADPQRSGPATAIVVNDTPYIVDAGPGIVRRAAAAFNKGVKGLAVEKLQTGFITHLHVDHTVGYNLSMSFDHLPRSSRRNAVDIVVDGGMNVW